jgi:hypothetical protein
MLRFCFFAFILGLAGLPGMGIAQVTMEAQLGLQGMVRLEKWNQVAVSLHNTGPLLQGTLGIRVWRGSEYRQDRHITTFTQAVHLPHHARKRFVFTVPIASITHPIEVFVRTADTVLAQQQLDLRHALSAEHIIVGLTDDLSLDFLAATFRQHTRVAYTTVRDLPRHWSGYDSVTAVVLKGVSLQAATEPQWHAMQQWLIRGGTLVVAGDSQYALLQEARLRQLLPVRVEGLQPRQGLASLAAHYGMPVPSVPLVAVQASLGAGHLLIGTPEAPLLAQRHVGEGRVVFLAVDYAAAPLDTWQGRDALWKDMLQPTETIDYSRVFAELGLLDDAHPMVKLLSRPILAYSSHMLLSIFLCLYCGSVALLFWWMRQRRARRRRCWGYIGVIVAMGTLLAYTLFPERGLRGPAIVHDLSTFEVFPGAAYGRARGYLGVFAPRGGHFQFGFRQSDTVLRHTFQRGVGTAGAAIEMATGTETAIRGITLDPWTLRVFSVENMPPAPLKIEFRRHATGLTIRVHNRGALPMQAVAVAYQGRLFELGTIAPGEELFEDLYPSLQAAESQYETTWQALFKLRPDAADISAAYLQEVLLQNYFGEKHLSETSHAPFLTGWLQAPTTLKPSVDTPSIHGTTLVVSQLVANEK